MHAKYVCKAIFYKKQSQCPKDPNPAKEINKNSPVGQSRWND